MYGKINDFKTDYKASRIERLELLTKINDVATKFHPDAIRYLIKEIIEIKMRKQESILNSDTVNIKLVESDIYALKVDSTPLR